MKKCTRCNETKEYQQFYKNKRMKDGHSSSCKSCDDAGNRLTRVKNPAKARSHRKTWKDALMLRINDWKASKGCMCCGEATPCCLELHHLDPTEKDVHPSTARTSWDRFMREAEKCVVVCSNCHKKIHADVLTLRM